jgi:phosphoribosyl-ATP pyrophosphohydrolase/phosphoribosyl-AMP cyclohydrolase
MIDFDIDALNFDKGNGVVTVVAQDADDGTVLMVAFADREAIAETTRTGEMHYRSRTRGLWRKGATSGNVQHVVSLSVDCDGDAVLALVRCDGPSCHTGSRSCFATAEASTVLGRLAATIERRRTEPAAGSYTARLLGDRNLRLKKIGEESAELVVALADRDRARAAEEAADLFYHALTALAAEGVALAEVQRLLVERERAR